VLVARDPLFPGEADAEYFDNVCRWLAEWFNVLPLDQAVDLLQQGTLPARAAAITFDDGYRDNHDVALPILRRHGLVATFFIATGYLDGGRMWNDTLIEAIRRAPAGRLDLSEQGFGVHELGDALSRRRAIDSLLPRIKYLDAPARQTAVDAIAGRAGASLPKDLMMTSAQVKALRREGMGIGGHTVSHPILAKLSDDAIAAELTDGRAALEDMVDAPVSMFAYPNGRPGIDYDARAVSGVRRAGYTAAVSTVWGAARSSDDLFQLPRFTPWDRSRASFAARLLRNIVQAHPPCGPPSRESISDEGL
jgi:peptidoglycan/xylan/chitin deacetylase (PgdA/CDA1 family)